MKIAEFREGQRNLEVCCGTGKLTMLLAKNYPDISIIALDISQEMLGRLNEKAKAKNLSNIMIVQADCEKMPFRGNVFDWVVGAYAIGGLNRKGVAICEIYRCLVASGFLCVTEMVPPPDSVSRFGRWFHRVITSPVVGWIWGFTDTDLKTHFLSAGFLVVNELYFRDRVIGSTSTIMGQRQ
jgi:ubiquinone/menaquinone biosynthesis C-methylase UbiE